ncbi:MAG: glyoxalase family protein [Gammaproteobacteria bacterium]|jgi:lactoylglutathione lyase|nr:glyoxalase family protein [Gammaproteobacteria bacterium]
MLRIEHVAFWTTDIERLASFYATYFGATVGPKYVNQKKGYESRFLSFEGGARIELMKSSTLAPVVLERGAQRMGLTHVAVSIGSEQRVDELTGRLKRDGFEIVDGPRHTGDGYYESVVLDPDGNRIEVTI